MACSSSSSSSELDSSPGGVCGGGDGDGDGTRPFLRAILAIAARVWGLGAGKAGREAKKNGASFSGAYRLLRVPRAEGRVVLGTNG
jgi:hypothetical protein